MPDIKGHSGAGYVDATFDITQILRGTAGFRFTHETKSRTGIGNVYGFDIPSGMGNNFRFGTEGFRFAENRPSYDLTGMNGVDVFQHGIASYGARDTLGTLLSDPTSAAASWASFNNQRGSYEDNFIDFRVGADANLRPRNLVYASFTTGHSSGGFNDNVVLPMGAGSIAPTYKPEALYATEIGSKNELFARKLRAERRGLLVRVPGHGAPVGAPDQPGGRLGPGDGRQLGGPQQRRGGAHHRRRGGRHRDPPPRPGRERDGTYLHARAVSGGLFDNRVAFGPTGGTGVDEVDISGNVLPRAPTWTVNYSLAQRTPHVDRLVRLDRLGPVPDEVTT